MATAQVAPIRYETPEPSVPAPRPIEAYPWLPCQTSVEIVVPRFTVGDLLRLEPGTVVRTDFLVTRDVPVRVNDILLGWVQFDPADDRLAARITEIA
jgi:flagellar motor switch/type III secretory pathway protein FliN